MNDEIKETRAINAESTASLQKQISMNTDSLQNIRPRLAKVEGDFRATGKKEDKLAADLNKAFRQIHILSEEKVPYSEERNYREN